uniref:DUF4160 domain-containing protein n=1 Tax=Candidatus Kentrum sp. DK TaxID=2126562 RepID=A0A450SQ81_9GAMM|nr:MAG: protein of unknown function (DUF4160) [Candidatus Kentron sp. DK]VFJ56096.1 MAG: protein of unknown function (DUF4160) [Candidatus Kentron sp. DK]
MPILQRFPASRILLYADDHLHPHVHVKLRDGRECTVDINSLNIQGRIAVREIREELDWIDANGAFLLDEWRRYNP